MLWPVFVLTSASIITYCKIKAKYRQLVVDAVKLMPKKDRLTIRKNTAFVKRGN